MAGAVTTCHHVVVSNRKRTFCVLEHQKIIINNNKGVFSIKEDDFLLLSAVDVNSCGTIKIRSFNLP